MRIFRSIFITFLVLLFCSVGVMADPASDEETPPTPPQYYVGENGQINTIPTSTTGTLEQIGTKEEDGENQKTVQNLEFGAAPGSGTAQNPEKWYWAGPSTTSNPIKDIKIGDTDGSTTDQGYINIIIPPNGDSSKGTVSMYILNTEGWNLTSGQTINIFQAANSLNADQNTVTISQCIFVLFNTNNPSSPGVDSSSKAAPTSALTLSGGNLNVYSGAFVPTAGLTAGLTVNQNSTVNVFSKAQLQPTINLASDSEGPSSTAIGLNISSGTVNNNGYLPVFQNYLLKSGETSTPNWGYAGIEGLTGLNIKNGGTVQTSTPYPTNSSNLTNGVWIESSGNGNAANNDGNNPIKATTNNITAFGEATLYTGFSPAIQLTGANSLTVNPGANLTIPDNYTLTFGTGSSTTTDGTLKVEGTLTISGKATVTMNKGSVLTNNGTIDVLEP